MEIPGRQTTLEEKKTPVDSFILIIYFRYTMSKLPLILGVSVWLLLLCTVTDTALVKRFLPGYPSPGIHNCILNKKGNATIIFH